MMMEIEGRYFQDDDSCGGGNIFRPFMAYFDLYDEIRVSPMFWGRNHQQRHELIMPNDIQGPMRLASLQDAELPELSTVPWKNKGLELLKQEFIIRGGSVVNVWCPGVTHVILLKTRMREEDKCVNNNNNNSNPFLASARSSSFSIKKPKRDRIDDFLEALIKIPDHHILKPLFVGGEWVEESVRKGRAVAEVGFEAQVGI